MWELDHKEGWALKNWYFWTVVLETLESPLDCKIKPAHPKGNQSWIFIGWSGAEAEAPILCPHDVKSWLTGKDPEAGKDWEQEEKGGDRGWDGWMASLTQWARVWVNSGSWWWTGRPGVLYFMESQRIRHDWATELNCSVCVWESERQRKLAFSVMSWGITVKGWYWEGAMVYPTLGILKGVSSSFTVVSFTVFFFFFFHCFLTWTMKRTWNCYVFLVI